MGSAGLAFPLGAASPAAVAVCSRRWSSAEGHPGPSRGSVCGLRAILAALALCCLALLGPATSARADDGRTVATALRLLPADYAAASARHDPAIAARLRTTLDVVAAELTGGGRAAGADASARRTPASPEAAPRTAALDPAGQRALTALQAGLAQTRDALQPWPVPQELAAETRALAAAARAVLPPGPAPADPYDAIGGALRQADDRAAAGDRAGAQRAALTAWTTERDAFATRLAGADTALDRDLWAGDGSVMARLAAGTDAGGALDRARADVDVLRQSLGDATVSKGSVITDAAILVFREGLEAVLILAAITASFTGARRRLRKPVLWGSLLGLGATAVTWVVAELLVDRLGNGGLAVEAITGLLAIGVLLLITNWFFHKVYWSQWISRFNKRRKQIERLDRLGLGVVSGQTLALLGLGATSVYREGFETVLFLQNLNVSAGSSVTLSGAGIGLLATLAVGGVTFGLQRKLPYKRMLVATGVMIALVLAVMVGSTIHVVQQLGWLPTTPTSFTPPAWSNRWLGLWPTWQGIGCQAAAFVFVIGSYVVARELQVKRPRRASRRRATDSEAPPLPAPRPSRGSDPGAVAVRAATAGGPRRRAGR